VSKLRRPFLSDRYFFIVVCLLRRREQVARTAGFAVRVFSLTMIAAVPYSIAVSKLRRPFLSDQYFFIAVRLLGRRKKFTEPDFALLARAFNRARALHPLYKDYLMLSFIPISSFANWTSFLFLCTTVTPRSLPKLFPRY